MLVILHLCDKISKKIHLKEKRFVLALISEASVSGRLLACGKAEHYGKELCGGTKLLTSFVTRKQGERKRLLLL